MTIERFGGRVTAPMKSTTFGWRKLRMISTYNSAIVVTHPLEKYYTYTIYIVVNC